MTIDAAALLAALGDYAEPGDRPASTRAWSDLVPPGYRRGDTGALEALVGSLFAGLDLLELYVDAVNYVAADEGGPALGTIPGGASILTDPARTPWPEWLAQAVGVDLVRAGILDPTTDLARESIATPVNGWLAGSAEAFTVTAQRSLTGTRTVNVRAGLDPDPWIITVSTVAAETPDAAQLEADLRAILPAGHDLALDNAVGSWTGIETSAATWTAIEALTTFDALEALYA